MSSMSEQNLNFYGIMQPSYKLTDLSDNTAKSLQDDKSRPPIGTATCPVPIPRQQQQQQPNLLDFNAAFLSISPMLALADNFAEHQRMGTLVGQLEPGFENMAPSPLQSSGLNEGMYLDPGSPLDSVGWSQCLDLDLDPDPLDDVFMATKEVLGGPTLAALNASEKSVLDDLELDDFSLPEEINSQIRTSGLTTPSLDNSQDCMAIQLVNANLIGGSNGTNVAPANLVELSTKQPQPPPPLRQQQPSVVPNVITRKNSTLHDLLVKDSLPTAMTTTHTGSPAVATHHMVTRLGGNKDVKVKVEPQSPPHALYETQIQNAWNSGGRTRTYTMSSVDSLADDNAEGGSDVKSEKYPDSKSEGRDVESHDEGFDSDLDDSDHYNDYSDAESVSSWDHNNRSKSPMTPCKSRKRERYFWQYNLQAKGPKGFRLPLSSENPDPHMLDEVTDPVFSPSCQIKGIKHTGKARRGDGNDLTPNPSKLYHIGQELKKLNKVINDLTPVSELPFNVRPKSRKEKNKLASRACRLKKKAQHEANKLKLYGLDVEHKQLMRILSQLKNSFIQQNCNSATKVNLTENYNRLMQSLPETQVAGKTIEYVNRVLDKVASGHASGGI